MLYLLPRLSLPPKTRGRLRWQGEGDLVGHVGSSSKTSVQVFCTGAILGGKASRWLNSLFRAFYWVANTTNSRIQAFKFLDISFVTASVAGHVAGTAALALGGLSLQNLRPLGMRKSRGIGRGRARNFTKLGKAQLKA